MIKRGKNVSKKKESLVQTEHDLSIYLDALLQVDKPVAVTSSEQEDREKVIAKDLDDTTTTPSTNQLLVEIPDNITKEQAREAIEQAFLALQQKKTLPEHLPAWARQNFEVIHVEVANANLALHVLNIETVQPWDARKITPMPGHENWFLGLYSYQDVNIPIINIASYLFPNKQQKPLDYHQIIIFSAPQSKKIWGMVCEKVHDMEVLQPDNIQWRKSIEKNPWLLGVIKERMCSILDVEKFAEILAINSNKHS